MTDIATVHTGDTRTWRWTVADETGKADLSGATLTFAYRIQGPTSDAFTTGTGTATVVDNGGGTGPAIIDYELSAADVATAGTYDWKLTAVLASGKQVTFPEGYNQLRVRP